MDQPRPAHLPVESSLEGDNPGGGQLRPRYLPDDEDDGGAPGCEDDTGSGPGLPHADDAGADDAESEASA